MPFSSYMQVNVHRKRERVTFEYLVERLGDYLLSHGPPEQQRESMHDSLSRLECMTLIEKEEPAAKEPILSSASPNPLEKDTSDPDGVRSSIADDVLNYRYHLDTALSLLPNLQVGLDVNVGFSFIRDFEATAELALFDLFDVDLVHGWIADPQDESTYNVVKACGSYNAIVDCVVHGDELSSQHDPSQSTPPTQHAERSITKGLIASAFLQDTATQLTYYGLELLVDSLPRNKLCVLFRNNHFSTLYKHPETEGLYTLVTDSGLVKERSFVWESLADIDQGASEFFDGFFKKPSLGGQNQTSSREESDLDLAIALSLQTYPTVGTVGPDSSLGNTRTEQIAIENGKESIHTKRMSRISSNSIESTKKRRDHCIVS
ncbi:hypothetical protein BDF14DRAFT_351177 [Spinellus fusiger]|nr:hypothetical protein BDF14DRAFT_351177 [Spinellus fusiger]